jgi:hypothetical protein
LDWGGAHHSLFNYCIEGVVVGLHPLTAGDIMNDLDSLQILGIFFTLAGRVEREIFLGRVEWVEHAIFFFYQIAW